MNLVHIVIVFLSAFCSLFITSCLVTVVTALSFQGNTLKKTNTTIIEFQDFSLVHVAYKNML